MPRKTLNALQVQNNAAAAGVTARSLTTFCLPRHQEMLRRIVKQDAFLTTSFQAQMLNLSKHRAARKSANSDYEVTPFGQGCDKAGRPRLVRRYEDRRATQGVEFSICSAISAEMSQASSEQAGANVSQSNTGTGQSPSSGRRLTEGRLKCLALAAKGITVVSLTQSEEIRHSGDGSGLW